MWYPSQEQQQQHSWYGYMRHPSSPQQQTYSKTSYYCNDDELSTTCVVGIENESPIHCQPTYGGNIHVTTPDCYVITSNSSYGDEMSSYQTATPTRKPYWSPIIAAPTKNMTIVTPPSSSSSSSSSSSPSSSSSACWDWLLFSPQYYSEFYTPSSTFVHHHRQKIEEEENDDNDLNFLASLPTCLLALLYLTPKLIHTSDDENDSDQEIGSLHRTDQPLLSSKSRKNISSNLSLSSDNNNNNNSKSNIDGGQKIKTNRSSTPDTDDGYQSASDASRSDYSQQSSIPSDHHNSKDDITIPAPLMPRRLSYAAAVKPIITSTNKISSLVTPINKPKQTITNISTNDMLNSNGQKLKFIAPRFERMHHAKQYPSSSLSSAPSSNRTQIRSTNYNNNHHQRNHIVNPTRRR